MMEPINSYNYSQVCHRYILSHLIMYFIQNGKLAIGQNGNIK